jgi:hypothetical protein
MKIILILLSFGLIACKKQETSVLCKPRFYFYDDKKYFLPEQQGEVWIKFNKPNITLDEVTEIISRYPNFTLNIPPTKINFNEVALILNIPFSCQTFDKQLALLNTDSDILSATPIFGSFMSTSTNFYVILVDDIIVKPDESMSITDFENIVKTFNLEIIKFRPIAKSYHLRVPNIKTGYEALEKANQINQMKNIMYAAPNLLSGPNR